MSSNSSSPSDAPPLFYCANSQPRLFISIGMIAAKALLLLPLSAFILLLGLRRWRRRRRSLKTTSHSDLFAYHLAAMETSWGLGLVCYLWSTSSGDVALMVAGLCALSLTFYGELSFHVLTCVERYLAVVHPVAYVGLRTARGARVRNTVIACVWLLCFGLVGLNVDLSGSYIFISMCFFLLFAILVVSFCSISVLCVLVRPGPGEGRGERGRADRLKRRAFVTVAAILSVLWAWFAGLLVTTAVSRSSLIGGSVECVVMASVGWFNVPTSLVSPLLYLHRAGKLPRCSSKPE